LAWWEKVRAPDHFWPDLNWSTLIWFAAVVVLALTIRLDPLLSLRNLDALVLAATCLLLGLREAGDATPAGGASWQRFAYGGLTVVAVYWLLRGVHIVLARQVPRDKGMIAAPPLLILLLAGLALCIHQLAAGPISVGARDGIVGGLYVADSGKLPYGDTTGFDRRSPLLYLVEAGAVKVAEPSMLTPDSEAASGMTWQNRGDWLRGNWWEQADLVSVRLVNALLFIGTLCGIYVIGRRLYGTLCGWTLAAVFCVFPGTLECLPRPETMLPALLLTWTIAFALLPAGGLLATLCLVLAGLAWPWAWLALPVLLAYFGRRGWQTAGSVVGLLAGIAIIVIGMATLAQPALPRPDGALAMASTPKEDLRPHFDAHAGSGGTIVVDRWEARGKEALPQPWSGPLWRFLVDIESLQVGPKPSVTWPNDVDGRTLYRDIKASAEALPALQADYRQAARELPGWRRLAMNLRTVLEETWMPAEASPSPTIGAWTFWGGGPPMESRWGYSRKIVKGVVVLLVIWATLAVFLGRRSKPRHLIGALLAVIAGALVASESGTVTNLVWLMPVLLPLWAVHDVAQPAAAEGAPVAPTYDPNRPVVLGPPPRVSIEN
jgi:hypothetical protein